MKTYQIGDKVRIACTDWTGTVTKIRNDALGQPIISIELDIDGLSPYFLTRPCELAEIV